MSTVKKAAKKVATPKDVSQHQGKLQVVIDDLELITKPTREETETIVYLKEAVMKLNQNEKNKGEKKPKEDTKKPEVIIGKEIPETTKQEAEEATVAEEKIEEKVK